MYINSFQGCGNLVADPELHYYETTPYTKFTLALNKPRADRPIYIDCIAWGKAGEIIVEYYRKGQEMYASGELDIRSYSDREGITRKSITLKIKEFSGGRTPASGPVISRMHPPRVDGDGEVPLKKG